MISIEQIFNARILILDDQKLHAFFTLRKFYSSKVIRIFFV